MIRPLVAELLGTAVLVGIGVGSAVTGFNDIGSAGVALAFGLVLLALVHVLGPVSGAHVNPAVTLGVLLAGRMGARDAALYAGAQILGGALGAAGLALLTTFGQVVDQTGGLGTNSWGRTISGPGAFGLEVALTAVLVLVVLRTTAPGATSAAGGALAAGAALTAVHLVGVPLDATSVNPARSIGPALFAGGTARTQLWLFVVAPLLGAAVAAGLHRLLRPADPGPAA